MGKLQTLKCHILRPIHAILSKIGDVTLYLTPTNYVKFRLLGATVQNSLLYNSSIVWLSTVYFLMQPSDKFVSIQ